METNRDNTKIITGIVYSARQNSKGSVPVLLIDSIDDDQEAYLVSPGKKGNELLDALYRKVEACGYISEDDRGNLTINIKSYKILEDS